MLCNSLGLKLNDENMDIMLNIKIFKYIILY